MCASFWIHPTRGGEPMEEILLLSIMTPAKTVNHDVLFQNLSVSLSLECFTKLGSPFVRAHKIPKVIFGRKIELHHSSFKEPRATQSLDLNLFLLYISATSQSPLLSLLWR